MVDGDRLRIRLGERKRVSVGPNGAPGIRQGAATGPAGQLYPNQIQIAKKPALRYNPFVKIPREFHGIRLSSDRTRAFSLIELLITLALLLIMVWMWHGFGSNSNQQRQKKACEKNLLTAYMA